MIINKDYRDKHPKWDKPFVRTFQKVHKEIIGEGGIFKNVFWKTFDT